jgi:hypothetical protein
MIFGWILHTVLGLVAAATGYAVRTTCSHRGWLPHPRAHIILTTILVATESLVAVNLFG